MDLRFKVEGKEFYHLLFVHDTSLSKRLVRISWGIWEGVDMLWASIGLKNQFAKEQIDYDG